MQKRQDVILNSRGEPVSGVSVRVVTFPVTADATIYSDDGITQTTNPLTTDANGRYSYYAADGRYSEQLSGAGITPLTVTDILLQDAVAATIPESLFHNLSLQYSIAGNALTIALKTSSGANPSTASPVRIVFRNATVTTGDHTNVSVASATAVTVSSGSTLGAINGGVPFRLWIVAFNDSGIVRLGIILCQAMDGTFNIYPLGQLPIASSTAEGGAGAADSAKVFYTAAAVTSKAYTILGYATYETGLVTPGTWNALPTKIQLFGPGVPLPGALVQSVYGHTAVTGTGTGIIPLDNTIPQDTEGDALPIFVPFVGTSAANVGVVKAHVNCASNSAASVVTIALFDNLTSSAKAAVSCASPGVNKPFFLYMEFQVLMQPASPITITLRIGADIASTTTVNGAAGAGLVGGVAHSTLAAYEYMV